MPSVSNIAIGANMAAAAADKARHGMNESIARLSTGIRAMYGADAAGHSVGVTSLAEARSFAQAARNIEDGISYAQAGEAVMLEVANLGIRLRELGIADNNSALLDGNQTAALDAESNLVGDTIDKLVAQTAFNGTAVTGNVDSKVAYSRLNASVHEVGPAKAITAMGDTTDAANADTKADTLLAEVAESLGNIAADLSALKAFQGAASATSANLHATAARLMDTDFARETASLTKNAILNQAALAMASQANSAQSAILAVLQ